MWSRLLGYDSDPDGFFPVRCTSFGNGSGIMGTDCQPAGSETGGLLEKTSSFHSFTSSLWYLSCAYEELDFTRAQGNGEYTVLSDVSDPRRQLFQRDPSLRSGLG